jgi:hypothetical protein
MFIRHFINHNKTRFGCIDAGEDLWQELEPLSRSFFGMRLYLRPSKRQNCLCALLLWGFLLRATEKDDLSGSPDR